MILSCSGKPHGGQNVRRHITRADVIVVLVISLVLLAILLPAYIKARLSSLKLRCRENLRELGHMLILYREKYGGSPPAPGKTYLNTLRNTPCRASSIAGDRDHLFVCPLKGTTPSPTAIDYRYAVGATIDPLSEYARYARGHLRPVAADMPCNHRSLISRNSINILMQDGYVYTMGFEYGDSKFSLTTICDSAEVLVQSPPQDGK